MHQNCVFVALYVGNLQGGMSLRFIRIMLLKHCMLTTYRVGCPQDASNLCFCSTVCWQPTGWDVLKMHQNYAFVALYVGNLQGGMSLRCIRIMLL